MEACVRSDGGISIQDPLRKKGDGDAAATTTEGVDREQQSITSEDGVVECLGKRKVHKIDLNCTDQYCPLIGGSNASMPGNQGLSGDLKTQRDVTASASESNAQGGAEKKRPQGYERENGRIETRYRPGVKFPLRQGDFPENFKGIINDKFQYDFLAYYDTPEESGKWLTNVKTEFRRCKLEALAANALLMMGSSKPPHTMAKRFPDCDPGIVPKAPPKKRNRCTTSKKRAGPIKAATQEPEPAVN